MTETPDALKNTIIEAYILHEDHAGGPLDWTWGVIRGLIEAPLELSWPFILEVIARAPDRQLGSIAAGPVEEFLGHHGEGVISAVEAQAAVDARFRRVLRGVLQLFMTDDVYARVVRAARHDEADDDEERRWEEDAELSSAWVRHRFDLTIDGLPPGSSDDSVSEAAALEQLLHAVGSDTEGADLPFAGPVFVEVVLDLTPEQANPDPSKVLTAILEALAGYVYPSARDVWRVEINRVGSKHNGYRLTVVQTSDDQVAHMTTAYELVPEELSGLPD